MLAFQKKCCVEVTHTHKMKPEEKRLSMDFVGLMGNDPSTGSGFCKSVLAKNLNYNLHIYIFLQQPKKKKRKKEEGERKQSENPCVILVQCLRNLSARTNSPALIQLHKNSLCEIIWG